MACREWSAQNPSLFTIFFFAARARFLRANRPFYSGLIKEPRGEPKIRNALLGFDGQSRVTRPPANEIHLHRDKCPCALAGIDSCDVTELISDVKFYVPRFPPLNRIRVFCLDATAKLIREPPSCG